MIYDLLHLNHTTKIADEINRTQDYCILWVLNVSFHPETVQSMEYTVFLVQSLVSRRRY